MKRGTEYTDDATIKTDVVDVSANIAGYLAEFPVVDSQSFYKGQVLTALILAVNKPGHAQNAAY